MSIDSTPQFLAQNVCILPTKHVIPPKYDEIWLITATNFLLKLQLSLVHPLLPLFE